MHAIKAQALPVNGLRLVVLTMKPSEQDLLAVVTGIRFSVDDFLHEEGYLSWPELHRMVSNIIGIQRREPGLSLLSGQRAVPVTHGPIGVAAMTSETLGEALGLFSKYMSTRSQIFVLDYLQDSADFHALVFNFLPEQDEVLQFLIESILASAFTCAEALLGQSLQGTEVYFTFPEPDYMADFDRAFPGCHVHFNAGRNAILVPQHYIDYPLIAKDRQLQSMALQQCEAVRDLQERKGAVSESILFRLQEAGGHLLTLDTLAEQMHLTRRTLIRRLQDEGTSYQRLYDSAISRRAVFLISLPGATVATVAEELGYAEPVSFRRAFRRWFGITPSEYRRDH